MKLRIGYREHELVDMEPDHARATGHAGEYDHAAGVIRIAGHTRADELADTLIHEVLHAIWADRDLGEAAAEEKAVTALAHGLVALARDNPAFIKAWLGAVAGRRSRVLPGRP